MDNKQIAETILAQLGGSKFRAMTGASSFSYGDKILSFRIGKNHEKIFGVRIKLENDDTYTMEFLTMKKMEVIVKHKSTGVYCDMLQEIFTKYTGLYTSL